MSAAGAVLTRSVLASRMSQGVESGTFAKGDLTGHPSGNLKSERTPPLLRHRLPLSLANSILPSPHFETQAESRHRVMKAAFDIEAPRPISSQARSQIVTLGCWSGRGSVFSHPEQMREAARIRIVRIPPA